MQRPLAIVARISGAAVVCLLAYRGVQLYFKNNITVYVTEVVHLPAVAGSSHPQPQRRRQLSARLEPGASLTVEGKVEFETCVMNSYRLMLKLAGHVRSSMFDATKLSSTSPRSARHRVLSIQASYGNGKPDDSFTSFAGNFGLASSASNCGGGPGSSGRRHGPSLVITSVDPRVDAYEADASGAITFTPACVDEGLLCKYTCVVAAQSSEDDAAGGGKSSTTTAASSSSSPGLAASPTAITPSPLPAGDVGLGNIYVRSCFLDSDGDTAYCQRLSMEVEFIRPVFGARVLIRLPSRHCRLHHSHTGGVGSVTQLLHQPRKCVWDIGAVTAEMCAADADPSGTLALDASTSASTAAAAADRLMPGAVVPAAPSPAAAKSCARLELVFEQAPPGLAFGEDEDEARGGSVSGSDDGESDDDTDDEDEDRFSSAVGNSSAFSAQWRRLQPGSGRSSGSASKQRASSSGRRPSTSASAAAGCGQKGGPGGSHAATGRARKREERARKAGEKAARIRDGGSGSTRVASGDDVPSVELVYSVSQLLSGTSVKKLQVVEERPNWVPRSVLDRIVLRRVVPGLEQLKLKKFAHYTTWFVIPVTVSQL